MARTAVWIVALVVTSCGPSVPIEPGPETSTTASSDDVTPNPTTVAPTSADEGTSSPSTSTSSGLDDSGTSGTFIPDPTGTFIPDPTGTCFTHCTLSCDLWAQDCADGDKCMPWANDGGSQWNDRRCTPLAEVPGAPGDACIVEGSGWSGIDDCQMSAMCWDVDPDTAAGSCVAFCGNNEANPICEGQTRCFAAYEGTLHLCLPGCDPLAPACDPGLACVESYAQALSDVFACVPEELVADRSTYADPCDDVIGCGTGLLCTTATDVPACAGECCTTLCDPLAENTCPDAAAGQSCIAHAATPTLGHCGFR